MTNRLKWKWTAGIAAVGCLVGLALWWYRESRSSHAALQPIFDGKSEDLQRTVIVPTLDTPLPAGKSAIWCAAFQLAWNQFKTDLAKGPIQLTGAQEIADRLNQAKVSTDDLTAEEYYTAAGIVKDGIYERIRREMATKFPNVTPSGLDDAGVVAIAYAYLQANVKYQLPFFDNDGPFVFKGTEGDESDVSSFGLTSRDSFRAAVAVRSQVKVLLYKTRENQPPWTAPVAFAIDLSKESQPNQVVFACLDRKGTLAENLALLLSLEQEYSERKGSVDLTHSETLLVPNMNWNLQHHFAELENKDFLNSPLAGLKLDTAFIGIRFQLDRVAARVESEARITAKGAASPSRHFHFDRPFLLYLKKREAEHPFFVMWVDNAELLQRRQ